MRLSTAQKMAVARGMFGPLAAARRLCGLGMEAVCRRRGVAWSLDLAEGVQLALYLGVYERTSARLMCDSVRIGDVVLDVGANVGAHTLPLARAVGSTGRIVAVEPSEAAFSRLVQNARLNPDLAERITPVQASLGGSGDSLERHYYSSWRLDAAGDHPVHLGSRQSSAGARFFTLDALVGELKIDRVAAIKIDVDGNELSVLRGAPLTLARDRPWIVIEVCPYLLEERHEPADALFTVLWSYDYEIFDEQQRPIVPANALTMLSGIPHGAGINVFAWPRRA